MSKHDTRNLIIDSALRAVGNASLVDTLSFLAPQRLADESHDLISREKRLGVRPLSAPTVALHFAVPGTARRFDRGALVDELLDHACARNGEIVQASAQRYLAAAMALREFQTAEPVQDAIAADVANYRAGGSEEPADDARARVYYLAMAMCDLESGIARKLREADAITDEIFVSVYDEFLTLTGRTLVDGYTVRDLAVLISMLLNGEEMRSRYGNTLSIDKLSEAVMRMFWAFTVARNGPTLDIVAEMLGGMNEAGC